MGNSGFSQLGLTVVGGRFDMMEKYFVSAASVFTSPGCSQGILACMDFEAACLAAGFVMVLCQGRALYPGTPAASSGAIWLISWGVSLSAGTFTPGLMITPPCLFRAIDSGLVGSKGTDRGASPPSPTKVAADRPATGLMYGWTAPS